MKSKIIGLGITFTLLCSISAKAAIVCRATTGFGNSLQVTIEGDKARKLVVTPAGAVELDETYSEISNVWDGHKTGLITAPGLSLKYENHYGCIRKVTITTNTRGGGVGYIEQLSVAGCTGGTTPDEVCFH
jgi:hypothetical protein